MKDKSCVHYAVRILTGQSYNIINKTIEKHSIGFVPKNLGVPLPIAAAALSELMEIKWINDWKSYHHNPPKIDTISLKDFLTKDTLATKISILGVETRLGPHAIAIVDGKIFDCWGTPGLCAMTDHVGPCFRPLYQSEIE